MCAKTIADLAPPIDLAPLIDKARQARLRAYAPYSKFRVGAALAADDGGHYAGCNVENAAYPQGACAEAGAIAAMICGGGRRISALVVAANRPVPPCGGCLQKISEFAAADLPITLIGAQPGSDGDGDDPLWHHHRLGDFLPQAFTRKALS